MKTNKIGRSVTTLVAMLLLWVILTGGDPKTLWFGLPAAIIAAVISARLPGGGRFILVRGLPSFIPFFLYQSLKGGIDVTGRALHPRMSLKPVIVSYPVRLSEGPASVFFRGVIGLFPGTLSAGFKEGRLIVHALDGDLPVLQDLEYIEERVGRLFGEGISHQVGPSDRP